MSKTKHSEASTRSTARTKENEGTKVIVPAKVNRQTGEITPGEAIVLEDDEQLVQLKWRIVHEETAMICMPKKELAILKSGQQENDKKVAKIFEGYFPNLKKYGAEFTVQVTYEELNYDDLNPISELLDSLNIEGGENER